MAEQLEFLKFKALVVGFAKPMSKVIAVVAFALGKNVSDG